MQTTQAAIPPYIQPIFESLRNPFQSPFCHMSYVKAICDSYPLMMKAKETTNSVIQQIAKSLIKFYVTPVDNTRCAELEARLFHLSYVYPSSPSSTPSIDIPTLVSGSEQANEPAHFHHATIGVHRPSHFGHRRIESRRRSFLAAPDREFG